MKNLPYLLLICLAFACSKDNSDDTNDPPPVVNQNKLLLKDVVEDGVIASSYEYYQDDKVKTRMIYNNGDLFRTDDYEYTADTTFRMAYDSDDVLYQIVKFFSVSDNVSRVETYDENSELMNYRVYTFSNHVCGFTGLEYFDDADNLICEKTFVYGEDNCSATSNSLNISGEVLSMEEWTRDGKNQNLQSTLLDFFRAESLGNTTEYKRWDENNILIESLSYESTFEYNSDDYPVSEFRTYTDGTEKNYTYTYY